MLPIFVYLDGLRWPRRRKKCYVRMAVESIFDACVSFVGVFLHVPSINPSEGPSVYLQFGAF